MSLKLTILGCNSALPTSQRFSSAQVLIMLERYFLIDCAEGTQIQLRKAKIKLSKINNIFISHLHGDHFLGIFGLLSTFNLLGRKNTLNIFAPAGFENVIAFHKHHIEHQLQFEIKYHPLMGDGFEKIYEDKKIEVFKFPLVHRITTFGFLFKEKEKELHIKKDAISKYKISISEIKSIKNGSDLYLENGEVIKNKDLTILPSPPLSFAYCSDTIFNPEIIKFIANVDMLYHESTFLEERIKRAKETFHTTAKEAGTIAKMANAKKLIIGHFSARYNDTTPFLEEAQTIFPNTELGEDCKTFFLDNF